MKNYFIYLLFALMCAPLFGNLENTRFQQLSTKNGLSQKTVQVIYQDSTGFIWFGTQEGLNKYDGVGIKIFRHDATQSNSISHDVIRDIAEDAAERLWIATSGGLNLYIPETDSFKRIQVLDNNEPVERFNTLYQSKRNGFLVGTDGAGLFRLNPESLTLEKIVLHESLELEDIREIFEDSRGRLWIGTDSLGVYLIYDDKVRIYNKTNSNFSSNRIRAIIEDRKGQVWVGTRGGGLYIYDELNRNFHPFQDKVHTEPLSNDRVYSITEDDNGRLWVCTDNGINVIDQKSLQVVQHKSSQLFSLSHNRVLSSFKDSNGILWFGTLSGVNYWTDRQAQFIHYRTIPEDQYTLNNDTIYSLAASGEDDILIGTFGGGINILDKNSNRVNSQNDFQVDDLKRVVSLYVDSNQNTWAGTISNGLFLFDSSRRLLKRFQVNTDDNISANGVTAITEDNDGDIWVSTYRSGLNLYSGSSHKIYNLTSNRSGLMSENIFTILKDEFGYIWLATDGGGLSRLDKKTDEIITLQNQSDNELSISGNIISSLFLDSRGRMWVGTLGNGLNLWAATDRRNMNNNFKHFSVNNGLASSTINAITEDDNGYIWISTVKGLTRIEPNDFHMTHFNLADEGHLNELNQGAVLKDDDGKLYFGGLNGVSVVDPKKLKFNDNKPTVVLTNILIQNEAKQFSAAIYELTELTISHRDYLTAFEFSALDYSNPEKNQYMYKLEGLDDDWIQLGNRSRATFTNLPAGEYILKVKGSNDDGVWSDESINLRITVEPAPWATWWAYSIYALLFCMLLIWLIRIQARRLAQNDMFQTQVETAVTEKIEMLRDHNTLVEEQYARLKDIAFVDQDSLLPNDRFLMEQLELLFKLITSESTQNNKLSFVIFSTAEQQETAALKSIQSNEAFETLFSAKWKASKLVVVIRELDLYNNQLEYKSWLKQLVSDQTTPIEKIAYIKPFSTLASAIEDPQLLMLLLEYVDSQIEQNNTVSILGIDDIYQTLSARDVADIVRKDELTKLEGLFKIHQSSVG